MTKITKINFSFVLYETKEELDETSLHLMLKAEESCLHAYAPYSQFCVGAAVLLDDGHIVQGNNQENAAYPSGLCAERVAIFSAAASFPDKIIRRIAIAAKRQKEEDVLSATPCGSCRQVLLEYEKKQNQPIELIMRTKEGTYIKTMCIKDLLPFAFSSDHLKLERK